MIKANKFVAVDLAVLSSIARDIAQNLKPQNIICLYGELGSGKTTLTQLIIKHLIPNNSQEITSPTFNLVNVYDSPMGKIWHFDLYRINKPTELYELGYEEAFAIGISIIEWPQIIEPFLPQEGVTKVFIEYSKTNDSKRDITIKKS